MTRVAVLAIGRSRILYEAIRAIAAHPGYRVAAIVTDAAYAEYDVGVSDFERLASELSAEFSTGRRLAVEEIEGLRDRHGIDIAISANWRYLIPATVLDRIPHGILNLHLGRLPDYKGNATANWAILVGEPAIYADVHRMAAELDAGDVLARGTLALTESTYIGEVLDWTQRIAPELFLAALQSALESPSESIVPGSPEGLRCYPRLPQDGSIDWTRSATEVGRLVRASSRPYPGAFTSHDSREIRVWRASVTAGPGRFLAVPGQVLSTDPAAETVDVACGAGVLRLEEITVEGQAVSPAAAFQSIRTRLGVGTASIAPPDPTNGKLNRETSLA